MDGRVGEYGALVTEQAQVGGVTCQVQQYGVIGDVGGRLGTLARATGDQDTLTGGRMDVQTTGDLVAGMRRERKAIDKDRGELKALKGYGGGAQAGTRGTPAAG
jgi:hypothetical protein